MKSNSFVVSLCFAAATLSAQNHLELPVTAIGKDYLSGGDLAGPAPSGSGAQVSLFGLGGLLVSAREGLELNLLGLVVGLDVYPPALKLPGIGRLGVTPDPVRDGT